LGSASQYPFSFRQEVEDFFLSRDRDFDGHLTFEEFLGEESAMEKLFKNMDKNKDGKVSKQVKKTLKNRL
jgi:Ca2+-binding EF-hand superfamily protein